MGEQYFITGTDTGVGKTSYAVSFIHTWRQKGINGIGLKPFASGDRLDALQFQQAMGGELSLEEINPCILQNPYAPYIAAALEGREIPYQEILTHTRRLADHYTHVVVEGAGGWLVPLTSNKMIRDFARDLGFSIILVARGGLGTINHTLLTYENIYASGLNVEKVILNRFPNEDLELVHSNSLFLSNKMGIPVEISGVKIS